MVDNFVCAGYTFYSKFDSGNLGRVELVRCCEGLNIIGNNVSTTSTTAPVPSPSIPALPTTTAAILPLANLAASPPGLVPAELQQLTAAPPSSAAALHHPSSAAATAALFVEVEFNLWTRPDCAGTPYENQNRTWFYFAVTGGRPNQIVKFNVMNLNKQAKLFSQGMHPVTKVGPGGRWERIKDKPSYAIANDVFFISFLHRAPESPETRTYYAFTFPFTYNELLEQLGNFDKRFGRHPFELHQIAVEVAQRYDSNVAAGPVEVVPGPPMSGVKKGKGIKGVAKALERSSPESFDDTARDGTGMDDGGGGSGAPVKLLDESELTSAMSVDDNNTSESMQQITNLVNKVKIELPQQQQPQPPAESAKGKLMFLQRMLKTPTLDDDSRATNLDPRDDIYYYRELLTHSVEKRRVELLTITSFHGIQPEREPRLRNLFPDERTPRCHTFKNKKIVFISSRVHPGETPASFVLNGFLSVLLDRKSIVAITLRRMYVFKIIPFLNPDGVYNGLYRSDTRGHNLNRVYLTPNFETQPSIYASRKLIRYFHLGTDEPEPYELEQEKKAAALLKSSDTSTEELVQLSSLEEKPPLGAEEPAPNAATDPATSSPSAVKKDSESTEENTPSTSDSGFGEGQAANLSKSSTISDSSSTLTLLASVDPLVMPLVPTGGGSTAPESTKTVAAVEPSPATDAVGTEEAPLPPPKVFTEQLIPDLLPVVTESQSTTPLVVPPGPGLTRPVRSASNLSTASSMTSSQQQQQQQVKKITAKVDTGRKGSLKNVMNKPNLIATTPNTLKLKDFGGLGQTAQQQQQPSSALSLAITGTKTAKKSSSSSIHHKRSEAKLRPQTPQMYSHFRSHRNEQFTASQKNLNISLDYLAQLDEKNDKVIYEEKSNMFLYIDLHGHASKKGVFMYGNHLPSTIEAIECMLLPRLMSINSLHFHYDACNFSERNMYYKGKRDGLSKEGSGRVAIYKCSGLIKSYTLECNYNTGKSVNQLPPRGKEGSTNKVQSPVPPKYTPAVFEEVGRALGPSILDLTNSNPQSRLHNSEFRTLQGLRNTLRIEIERGSSKARVTNKVPKTHSSKRLSNQSSSSLDVAAKENALQWEPQGSICGGAVSGGGAVTAGITGSGSPTGAGSSGGKIGEVLGGNGGSATSSGGGGGRQFLKGGGGGVGGKTHSGKISRKGAGIGGKGFGKKDAVKKTKILCESGVAVGAVVAAGGKKLQELMRGKDQHQVPRKKIKVSPPHQPQLEGFDLCFKSTGLSATSLPNFLAAPPSLGEHPLSKKVKSESKLIEECLDCDDSLDAPCCSYTLPTTAVAAATKLITTFSPAGSPGSDIPTIPSSPPGSGSGCSSSGSGGPNASDKDGTSSAGSKVGGKISKFSKATSAKSKLGKSSKSNDGSGKLLKKKRSLKTDSNLKRKKTRVKPALT